jgi:hypothetical protein
MGSDDRTGSHYASSNAFPWLVDLVMFLAHNSPLIASGFLPRMPISAEK